MNELADFNINVSDIGHGYISHRFACVQDPCSWMPFRLKKGDLVIECDPKRQADEYLQANEYIIAVINTINGRRYYVFKMKG